MASKRLQTDGADQAEDYLFKCICLMTEKLLGKVRESAKIYGVMYQLAETCFTAKFVQSEIVMEHRLYFSFTRSLTEDPNITSFLEYFMKLSQLSRFFS